MGLSKRPLVERERERERERGRERGRERETERLRCCFVNEIIEISDTLSLSQFSYIHVHAVL